MAPESSGELGVAFVARVAGKRYRQIFFTVPGRYESSPPRGRRSSSDSSDAMRHEHGWFAGAPSQIRSNSSCIERLVRVRQRTEGLVLSSIGASRGEAGGPAPPAGGIPPDRSLGNRSPNPAQGQLVEQRIRLWARASRSPRMRNPKGDVLADGHQGNSAYSWNTIARSAAAPRRACEGEDSRPK